MCSDVRQVPAHRDTVEDHRGAHVFGYFSGQGARGVRGAERASFSASGVLDRRDFGLTWNQALETAGVLVGNEIKLSLEMQAVRAG